MRAITIACFLLIVMANTRAESITPIQAKQIRSIEVVEGDELIERQTIHETYFRSSDGSVYQRGSVVHPDSGEILRTITVIFRAAEGAMYKIDETTGVASIGQNPFRDPLASFGGREYPADFRREEYLGRICVILPIRSGDNTTGEAWTDEQTNTILYRRLETPFGGTRKRILTTRVTEFLSGIEPENHYFAPELEGYSVIDDR